MLLLGDSFTWGSGVPTDSSVFAERLERRLDAEFAARGWRVEILNGGIGGSLTDQWVDLLIRVRDSFKPASAVIMFFHRDGTMTSSKGAFIIQVRRALEDWNKHWFRYRHSYVFPTLKDYKDRRYVAREYGRKLNDSYLGTESQTEEWHEARANILAIRDIAGEIGVVIGFVVFPVLVRLNGAYPFEALHGEILSFARAQGIPTHDLLPAFKGRDAPALWVSAFDQHPNAKGHEVAANSMLPFLRQLLEQRIEGRIASHRPESEALKTETDSGSDSGSAR